MSGPGQLKSGILPKSNNIVLYFDIFRCRNMCLLERYLIVALLTEEDFKDIFGKETLVEKDTDHVCTTGSIQNGDLIF
jgi:hypothetical protein